MFTVGSFSRLVRWYLPVFVLAGMILFASKRERTADSAAPNNEVRGDLLMILTAGFLAVFAIQILAPFPYEDYQVPAMALLAVAVAAKISSVATISISRVALLTLGMTWACSFGSPLLEKWTTNPQDRFWPRKKAKCELSQLQDMAKVIEALDPNGDTLLTQDLYLAIETNRKVPDGLEMGPFSIMTPDEWRTLLKSAPCEIAALSGYTFAIEPPVCNERPIEQQMDFWGILKANYNLVMKEDAFGQNATPLLILQRKGRVENVER